MQNDVNRPYIPDRYIGCISIDQMQTGGNEFVRNKGYGYGAGFALIVVLFILLIIVGASWYRWY